MKKLILPILICLFSAISFAQDDIKTYIEIIDGDPVMFADSKEYCPVTFDIELQLKNVSSSEGPKARIIIPPRSTRFKMLTLKRLDSGKPAGIGSKGTLTFGDYRVKTYDISFNYHLPYKKGKKFLVWQGYNGNFSHKNENAIDFGMPEGTIVTAIRSGIVVAVIDKNDQRCAEEKCKKYNNYVLIYHSDGTFVEYTHIQKDGALIKKGDSVGIGQEIALSGNTGWSSDPHLHLVVFLNSVGKRLTLKTKFLIKRGKKEKYLKESKSYKKDY